MSGVVAERESPSKSVVTATGVPVLSTGDNAAVFIWRFEAALTKFGFVIIEFVLPPKPV